MKKFLSLTLAFVLALAISVPAFAAEPTSSIPQGKVLELPYCQPGDTIKIPVGDAEYIDDGSGNLIKISDLLSFETQEDANTYMNSVLSELEQTTQYNPSIDFNLKTRATHGDAIVASKKISFAGHINLGVIFTTSGDHNTGTITHHKAYTTFTGFTLGFGWDESVCSSQITSSGKDIYAVANGTLTYNLLVDGFIELGREPVHLEGYCWTVR